MDELDQQIQDAKDRLKKTQQLAELQLLQKQADAISQPQGKTNTNDPMQRILKWAFPIGFILAGIGVVFIMALQNFILGLTCGALGAMAIGIKLAFTPSIRIPIIDDRKPKQEVTKP